jgi:mono/diheme cytochrome c family protein
MPHARGRRRDRRHRADHALAVERVTNGSGAMPAFKGQLSDEEIQNVAAYVVQATSGS